MTRRVVLAFSGGLDTSFCVPYLRERGWDVVTVYVDTGGGSPGTAREVAGRARALGAERHFTLRGEQELFDRVIVPLIRCGGFYQGAYPVMCSDRYLIAEKCVEVARRVKAGAVAHGSTGMGNDQVRFDTAIRALSRMEVVAPIRDFQETAPGAVRDREIAYLEARGFRVPRRHRRYSVNENLLGTTISGSEIDRNEEPAEEAFTMTRSIARAPRRPARVRVRFRAGVPTALDGRARKGPTLLRTLHETAGRYGVGRFLYTGDCVIGIKGRIAFECPGLEALAVAHRALEEAVLTREQLRFATHVSRAWSELVYSGLYHDPLVEDLETFLESQQREVTGEVTLRIDAGRVLPVAITGARILKDPGTVYAQSSTWRPSEAAGFCLLHGLGSVTARRRRDAT